MDSYNTTNQFIQRLLSFITHTRPHVFPIIGPAQTYTHMYMCNIILHVCVQCGLLLNQWRRLVLQSQSEPAVDVLFSIPQRSSAPQQCTCSEPWHSLLTLQTTASGVERDQRHTKYKLIGTCTCNTICIHVCICTLFTMYVYVHVHA